MRDISDLYQELIIDHSRAPKNFGGLCDKTHCAHGDNPLCGDEIDVDIKVANDLIENISFTGDGCAISKASASLMTQAVKGKSVSDSKRLFDGFQKLVTGESEDASELGKLAVLKGVRQFPSRVKCATLCWHTLSAALDSHKKIVTTE